MFLYVGDIPLALQNLFVRSANNSLLRRTHKSSKSAFEKPEPEYMFLIKNDLSKLSLWVEWLINVRRDFSTKTNCDKELKRLIYFLDKGW